MSGESKVTMPPRVNVLGVGISAIDLDSAAALIANALERREKGYICVTGVHGVSEAQSDPGFRGILNRAFLNTPDGMPMVWMGRIQGFRQIRRVYGPDLMLRICQLSEERGFSHYFYGGGDGVADRLRSRLIGEFPRLKVVGVETPPFRPLTPVENNELAVRVSRAKPDVMWVGLSTPKQEKFMAENWQRLDATLLIGVGAAFDFHSGTVRQAPRWMQRSGLEWLFRLCCEPRRLWRRYLKNNPLFVVRAFAQISRLRRYEVE
jgi:N-acetylglucosaminyldiphosphoundecaprenol N-acetyl-beta-D-mannosaminyltransferase